MASLVSYHCALGCTALFQLIIVKVQSYTIQTKLFLLMQLNRHQPDEPSCLSWNTYASAEIFQSQMSWRTHLKLRPCQHLYPHTLAHSQTHLFDQQSDGLCPSPCVLLHKESSFQQLLPAAAFPMLCVFN